MLVCFSLCRFVVKLNWRPLQMFLFITFDAAFQYCPKHHWLRKVQICWNVPNVYGMIKKWSICNTCGKRKKTERNKSPRHMLAKFYQTAKKASITLTAIKNMEFAILCTTVSPRFKANISWNSYLSHTDE